MTRPGPALLRLAPRLAVHTRGRAETDWRVIANGFGEALTGAVDHDHPPSCA